MTEAQRLQALHLCDRIRETAAKLQRDLQREREVIAEEVEKYQENCDADSV